MGASNRCRCRSCTIRSMTGPALIITLGVLILLSQVHGRGLDLSSTWPMMLVVAGAFQIASAFAPREGHVDPPSGMPQAPPAPPIPPIPPGGTTPTFTPTTGTPTTGER